MGSIWIINVNRARTAATLLAVTLAIAFCNSEGGSGSGASSSAVATGSGGASSNTTSGVLVGAGGTFASASNAVASGTGGQGGGEGVPIADAGIPDGDVPPEPVVACGPDADAGDGDVCPLPPPTCATGQWMIYYDNPQCVNGLCHFETFAYDCAPKICINGGCEYNFHLVKRVQAVAGVLAVLLVPGASRLVGSGRLSWTMYSKIEPYRLRLQGTSAQGKATPISPTSVAAYARGHAAIYLAGAEAWRPISAGTLLRDHLTEIALLACRLGPFVTVEIELSVRRDLDAPAEATVERVACDR